MKLLHVVWAPRIGGAELFVLRLARRQAGTHEVTIMYLGATDEEVYNLNEPNIHLAAGGVKSGFDIIGLLRFAWYLVKAKHDIIHHHQNIPAVAVSLLFGIGSRIVKHEHGTSGNLWKTKRECILSHFINCFVPVYIANSENTKQQVVKHEKVASEKIKVIPCGIDLSAFKASKDVAGIRTHMHIDENAPVITFIGRLVWEKGLDDFVAVAEEVMKIVPKAQFLIAGDGPLFQQTLEAIQKKEMSQAVHMLGFRDDIPDILSISAVLLVTSRREAQGQTPIEAMAMGVPTVAFSVGGLPEVVGDAGVIIPERDTLGMARQTISLLKDSAKYSNLKEKCLKRVQIFSLEKVSEQIDRLYGSLTD